MLALFIVIVITAEVIITCQVISFILKLDKKICDLNNQITEITPEIERGFLSLRISLNKLLLKMNEFEQKLQSKKEEFKFKLLKNIITTVLFFALNTNGKKIITTIELAFDIKDFFKKLSQTIA